MNGGVAGDEKENWTYTGKRGQTVIDYVIGNGEVRKSIGKFEIGERVESDHQPLSVWVKGEGIRRAKGIGVGKGRWDWSMEGREEFREEMGKMQGSGETVEREWEARTEDQVWEVVRRERRKGEGGSEEGIEMREWNDYFKELLGGVEDKVTLGAYGVMRGEEALGKEEADKQERGVMVLFFVDLKAAFDSVNRRRLVETLGERGELWGRDLGLEGEGKDGKVARKIFEVGVGSGLGDAGLYGYGGTAEGYVEGENGEKGMEI
ncbi:hypothetical protein RF55_13450 [Lasius niger]|uniref:Uncharacterized protein n=1 Tax=Lasius niger TaxID=67767 RepID=A0A0J7KAH8_LASNI|nr:hypothetical protein RF55_13450 [Lasius niger]